MKKKLILSILTSTLFAAQDEHTIRNEYGKNLYENPRGIACNKCHGNKGEGSVIARYKHKGVEKSLIAPRINNIDYSTFSKALHKQKGVMPSYYLTDEEITAIYMYIYQP
ncbi:cytochrome c [Helicobacter mastomyrinus]|uniref:Cytochrome c n=1 Tax=Helicobacter mastomyrinus TaxID=287948 RepID=A0ABZ3F6W1_9HELI|nr:cytochrome c [uncultured Helicobacter sp.]